MSQVCSVYKVPRYMIYDIYYTMIIFVCDCLYIGLTDTLPRASAKEALL